VAASPAPGAAAATAAAASPSPGPSAPAAASPAPGTAAAPAALPRFERQTRPDDAARDAELWRRPRLVSAADGPASVRSSQLRATALRAQALFERLAGEADALAVVAYSREVTSEDTRKHSSRR